jgi:hypothetical protein
MPDSIGSASAAGRTNPIAATKPPASAPTQVIAFDEVAYVCQPGDTFQTISKRFYQSDTFAVALQRHNRNHFRASDQMARDGTFQPGEQIFIPPADILEQRYGDAIGRSTTPASSIVPASTSSPGGSPAPVPLPSSGGSPPPSRQ